MQPPSPRGARIGLGVIALVAIGVWAASGFIVQEGQVAVVTQFGKYKSTSQAGFQWRLPYPIQSHETVNVSQLRTFEVGFRGGARNKVLPEALMLTTDENIVDMQFVVQYRLRRRRARLSVHDPRPGRVRAPGLRDRDARDRRQADHGLRAVRRPDHRGQSGSGADAADPGSLPDRHPGQHRGHPERAAARAGAGRVRRRRQGWPGPRAPDQRRPGLRQPGRAAGQRSGLAHAGAGRGLQGQGDRRCAG